MPLLHQKQPVAHKRHHQVLYLHTFVLIVLVLLMSSLSPCKHSCVWQARLPFPIIQHLLGSDRY